MTWLIIPAAALLYATFWRLLGLLPALARRISHGPRRGPGLNPHIPHPAASEPRTTALASIWPCNCLIVYLHDGGTLFVSCGQHRHHPDWQAWETQMTTEGQE